MRHHYVPRFLLSAWSETRPDNMLEAFNLNVPGIPSKPWAPKAVAYATDLYALTRDKVAGMDKQAIEEGLLKPIDSEAAKVHDFFLNHSLRDLTSDQRKTWTIFLLSLVYRQPEIIQQLREQGAEYLRAGLAEAPAEYEELACGNDPESLEQWSEHHFPGIVENFGLNVFSDLVGSETAIRKLFHFRWWIWDFSRTKHTLLIGDRPFIRVGGIDDSECVLALPIGPRKAFIATKGERLTNIFRQADATRLIVWINEKSLSQAKDWIYARDEHPRVFIENRIRR